MAYINAEGKGPYPRHAGEFCGNYLKDSRITLRFDQDPAQTEEEQRRYLSRTRFGAVMPCKAFPTSEDGARQGYVGLYLRETGTLSLPGDRDVPTPPELMEPGREHLYNVNGRPGLSESDARQPSEDSPGGGHEV